MIAGPPTSNVATMTITDAVTGPPSSIFGSDCSNWQKTILFQVLSNAVNFTTHSKEASPDQSSFIAWAGDWVAVKPAINLRLIRNVTSACVRFTLYDE